MSKSYNLYTNFRGLCILIKIYSKDLCIKKNRISCILKLYMLLQCYKYEIEPMPKKRHKLFVYMNGRIFCYLIFTCIPNFLTAY